MTPARIQPADIPAGTRVRITGGPLTGTRGVVVRKSEHRFGDEAVFEVVTGTAVPVYPHLLRRSFLEVVT